MIDKFKNIKNDEFTKNGFIMFAASILAGILNYIYQVYMGGILGPEKYGEFGALFAIFYIVNVFSSTISTSTTNFVSKFIGDGKHIGFFIKGTLKNMLILGFIFSIIFLLSIPELIKILKITDYMSFLILIFIVFVSFIFPIIDGSLRGVKKFTSLGISGVSNSLVKLIFGILLVIFGFGVAGALAGLFLGMVFGLILSSMFLKPFVRPNNPHEPVFKFSSFYFYSIPVILAMLSISVPGNLDVILAKSYFSAADAGIYTSVSVLGKIIFFIPSAVYTVMFPIIVEKYVKGEDTIRILKKSLLYTAILSGTIVLIYYLFPDIIIKIFGYGYKSALPLIFPYGMTIFLFSLNVVLVNYFLAIKNIGNIIYTLFTIIEIFLLSIYHSSLIQMIQIIFGINLIYLIFGIYIVWNHCKCEVIRKL